MRLLVTEECGRLARWLRLMGYDAVCVAATPLSTVYQQAYNEQRIVVTRNHRVRPGNTVRVVSLTSVQLEEQLQQLIRAIGLKVDAEQLFTRCDRCNVPVEPVEKVLVKDHVPPYVYQTQQQFYRCPTCQRMYWAATHWQRASTVFDRLTQ